MMLFVAWKQLVVVASSTTAVSRRPPQKLIRRQKLLVARGNRRWNPSSHYSYRYRVFAWVLIVLGGSLYSSWRTTTSGVSRRRNESSSSSSETVENWDRRLDSSWFTSEYYASQQEQDDRVTRFPSVDERLRLYLSNWYAPPCQSSSPALSSSKNVAGVVEFHSQAAAWEDSPGHKVFVREVVAGSTHPTGSPRILELQGHVQLDSSTLFYWHPAALHECRAASCRDVVQTLQPLISGTVPVLLDLGDKFTAQAYHPRSNRHFASHPAVPFFKRFRAAYTKDELHQLTNRDCGTETIQTDLALGQRVPMQPILWNLKTERHYGMLSNMDDIPYSDKKNKAVFRGRLSGIHKEGSVPTSGNATEICWHIPRCRLVLLHNHHRRVDARLVGPRKGLPETLVQNSMEYEMFADEPLSISEMLRYKAIVIMEGNDVATALKWALYSNSVVLMESVTITSWAMEELLQPWVHYVPITSETVAEQLEWVLRNPTAAQRIAYAGSLWMKDLVFHPEALMDERKIQKEMMQRYESHFRANDKLV